MYSCGSVQYIVNINSFIELSKRIYTLEQTRAKKIGAMNDQWSKNFQKLMQ